MWATVRENGDFFALAVRVVSKLVIVNLYSAFM